MASVLHLLKSAPADLALAAIEQQRTAGDTVTVALLHGAPPPLAAGIPILRVPGDVSYAALLDLIFASDHVVTW